MRPCRLLIQRISACHRHHNYSFRHSHRHRHPAIPRARNPSANTSPDFHHRRHQYQQAPNICVLQPRFYLWNGEITNEKQNKKKNWTSGAGRILGQCLHSISSVTQCPWVLAAGPRRIPARPFSRLFRHSSHVSVLILIFVRLAALSAVKCRPLFSFSTPVFHWLLAFPPLFFAFSSGQSCLTRGAKGGGFPLVFNLFNIVSAPLFFPPALMWFN